MAFDRGLVLHTFLKTFSQGFVKLMENHVSQCAEHREINTFDELAEVPA